MTYRNPSSILVANFGHLIHRRRAQSNLSSLGISLGISLVVSLGISLTLASTAFAASLDLDRKSYLPGERITVTFQTAGLASDAWAGIVPSKIPHGSESENDRHDISYQYIRNATSNSMTFEAPSTPGSYDVRLHDTDNDGREVASVSFEVVAPDLGAAALSIEKKSFIPGEVVKVRFEVPEGLPRNAWVGIVPSSIRHGEEATNDQHDVAFQYLELRVRGTLDFNAPAVAGSYDFRLHDTDSNGREIASVSFSVLEHVNSEAIAEQLSVRGKVPLYGIRFASGQASVGESSSAALAEVGRLLLRDRTLRLRIDGHTDDRGSSSLNQELSERRAKAVRSYLVETFSLDPSRLSTSGRGDTSPMASNETEAGRAQNRRVELVRR